MNLKQPTLTLVFLTLLAVFVFAQIVPKLLEGIVADALLGRTEDINAKLQGAGLKPVASTTSIESPIACEKHTDCPDTEEYGGCGVCGSDKTCRASTGPQSSGKPCRKNCQCISGNCDKTTGTCLGPCKEGYAQWGIPEVFGVEDWSEEQLVRTHEFLCEQVQQKPDAVLEDVYYLYEKCYCQCSDGTIAWLLSPCSEYDYFNYCKYHPSCPLTKPWWCFWCTPEDKDARLFGGTTTCYKCTTCDEKCKESEKYSGGTCKETCDAKFEDGIGNEFCKDKSQTCCCRKKNCCDAKEFSHDLPPPEGEPTYTDSKITHYYTCKESEEANFDACLMMEGSGVKTDGRVVNYLGADTEKTYPPCNGVTACGYNREPYRTIAAASNFACGTRLYIHFGATSPWTGCYEVHDRGGAVSGTHFDMFTGVGREANDEASVLPQYAKVWVC